MRFPLRLPRFRLAALLGAVGIICVLLAVWSEGSRKQARAVCVLRSVSATIGYSVDLDKHDYWFVRLLRKHLGDDWLATATSVNLQRWEKPQGAPAPSDEEVMRAIGSLRYLENIDLPGAPYTDLRKLPVGADRWAAITDPWGHVRVEGFRALRGLTRLKRFKATPFGGRGLVSHVPRVGRWGPEADDALDFIYQNAQLEELDLQGLRVGDEFGVGLAALKKLRVLLLDATAVGDRTAAAVASMQQLEELSLGGTLVSDAGARDIARMQNVRILRLNCTKVTDASVPAFAAMPRLISLSIGGYSYPYGPPRPVGRECLLRLLGGGNIKALITDVMRQSLKDELTRMHPGLLIDVAKIIPEQP